MNGMDALLLVSGILLFLVAAEFIADWLFGPEK